MISGDPAAEAAGETLRAIDSGRLVPSNYWRVAEIVDGMEAAGAPEAADLRDSYETLRSTTGREIGR